MASIKMADVMATLKSTGQLVQGKLPNGERFGNFQNSKIVDAVESAIAKGTLLVGTLPVRVSTNTTIKTAGPDIPVEATWIVDGRHVMKSCPSADLIPVFALASVQLSTADANKSRQEFMAAATAKAHAEHGKPAGTKTSRAVGNADLDDDLLT